MSRIGWRVTGRCATFSVIYFADIFVRSSQKCFWFDELFTIYLCRLPKFRATWEAVNRGADFNPPLLYLLTRAVEKLFGEGLIATRLPEMVGVWVFCLCLFSFVSGARAPAGLIAGLFLFLHLRSTTPMKRGPTALSWAGADWLWFAGRETAKGEAGFFGWQGSDSVC